MKKSNKSLVTIMIFSYLCAMMLIIVSIMLFVVISAYGIISDLSFTELEEALLNDEILVESYENINLSDVLELGGWVEVIENNKIIHIIGEKKDKIHNYGLENIIKSYEDLIENNDQMYSVKSYFHNEKLHLVKVPSKDFYLKEKLKEQVHRDKMTKNILSSLLIVVIFAGGGIFIIFKKMLRQINIPLNKVEIAMKKIVESNYNIRLDFDSYREINEIKNSFNQMAEKLRVTQQLKSKAEESKKNMIRDISHDIKTPITSIIGYSKAILDGKVDDKEEKLIYLEYIYNKTLRLNYLVDELFSFTKLDSKEYVLTKKKQNVGDFLIEVMSLYYGEIEEKNFNFEFDIPDEPIICEIAEKELERAIGNLITNSLKYNKENTSLSVKLIDNLDEIKIIVADNGVGIDENVKVNVFDEFVRGDRSRSSSGGSGLGLSITKKVIELHGGEIKLNTKLNGGCEFIIILPK